MPVQAALITALIVDRPMCLDCLAARTSMEPEALETALEVLGRVLVMHRYSATTCDTCGATKSVVALERPPDDVGPE